MLLAFSFHTLQKMEREWLESYNPSLYKDVMKEGMLEEHLEVVTSEHYNQIRDTALQMKVNGEAKTMLEAMGMAAEMMLPELLPIPQHGETVQEEREYLKKLDLHNQDPSKYPHPEMM